MHAAVVGIEYWLPEKVLTVGELDAAYPRWRARELADKTGIHCRHVAEDSECASDLGLAAAAKLFQTGICDPGEIDFILFCSQSPDYTLPTTACLMQERLQLPTHCGSLDFNLGCSGFVYGLGLAKGLIVSGQARRVLLITAETYSKYLDPQDKNTRTIFGDGAAATLLTATESDIDPIGPFCYGTDGRGGQKLIVRNSGARRTPAEGPSDAGTAEAHASQRPEFLHMDGADVFKFALEAVPRITRLLLDRARLSMDEISLFVFHQANAYMLGEIGHALNLPAEKIQITLNHCGNTVSSTIPIALKHASLEGKLAAGDKVALVGFGVGYSLAATIIRWL